jgi:hypothetical protein
MQSSILTKTEIDEFIESIGGREPSETDEHYSAIKSLLQRRNYFVIQNCWTIIKISRNARPFWGVRKLCIDEFSKLRTFHLILLSSSTEGWIFSKPDILEFIESGRWKVSASDDNYKINMPLPNSNSFTTPNDCLRNIQRDS